MSNEQTAATPEAALVPADPRKGGTSASSAHADELCKGRFKAQKGQPQVVTEDASFGTAVHEALRTGDPSKLEREALSVYESCSEIREQVLDKFFGPDRPKVKFTLEHRFECKVLATPNDTSANPVRYHHSGQVDLLARVGGRALIIEYKALPGEVASSPSNKQLRDQVVLAARTLMLEEVGTAVIQPLVTHTPDICLYDKESIKKSEQEMFVRVRNSNGANPPRTPNPVSCKFCLAKPECDEYQKWVSGIIPESLSSSLGLPVSQWTPEMRSRFCEVRGVARKWLDECEDAMKAAIKADPASVPGWTVGEGRTLSEVNDPQELFNRFVAIGSDFAKSENTELHADAVLLPLYMQCLKLKKGEFDTVLRKVTGMKGKALAAKLDELLSGITTEKQTAGSLERV